MKFTLVKGTFRPIAGIPDGDTVKFKPQCWSTLEGLESAGRRLKKSKRGGGTVALRYEGIDAPERGAKEPFASAATAKNIELLGLRDVYDEGPGVYFGSSTRAMGQTYRFRLRRRGGSSGGWGQHLSRC